MKKSIFALVMALVLCLSTCAVAETTLTAFEYTAEEYIAGYTQFAKDALQKELTWSEPIETEDGLVGQLGTVEGMSDVAVYTLSGDTACCAVITNMECGVTDSDMNAKSQAFGMSVAAIPFASRYVELDNDIIALSGELQEIQDACMALVQAVFSTDAISTAMTDGSYSEVTTIAGHSAEMTLEMDAEAMTIDVTFFFMP